MRSKAYPIALGGMLAAVTVVLMTVGTVIPIATYAAPVLCMAVGQVVLRLCGCRIAWAWYGAVSILGLLLAPDKEAAAVFVALGYYPIVKPDLETKKLPWLRKGLLFNCSILLMYWILMYVMGLDALKAEFSGMGIAAAALLLFLGNVTFFLFDRALTRRWKRKIRWGRR